MDRLSFEVTTSCSQRREAILIKHEEENKERNKDIQNSSSKKNYLDKMTRRNEPRKAKWYDFFLNLFKPKEKITEIWSQPFQVPSNPVQQLKTQSKKNK